MVEPDQSLLAGNQPENPGRPRPVGGWTRLLQSTIQAEILPALLSAAPALADAAAAPFGIQARDIKERDIEAFVTLILADDQTAAREAARRVLAGPGGRQALLADLLTQAARHLGLLWERDECDFMDVTLGVHRLDMLMRETEFADGQKVVLRSHGYRALLLPAPGEQHRFGIAMVADVFRAGGWGVCSGAALPRARLTRQLRDEWFDVLGLSISAERGLGSIATCLRVVRKASRNRDLLILLGGNAIIGHEERSRFLGADILAMDAGQALEDANMMMANPAKRETAAPLRQFIST
jgi:methylmalonyl-CoA mutase cobalamin-binding subunit